jgi:hypothetical protein
MEASWVGHPKRWEAVKNEHTYRDDPLEVQIVEHNNLCHNVKERFQMHKEPNQQKKHDTITWTHNNRIRDDTNLSNFMAPLYK